MTAQNTKPAKMNCTQYNMVLDAITNQGCKISMFVDMRVLNALIARGWVEPIGRPAGAAAHPQGLNYIVTLDGYRAALVYAAGCIGAIETDIERLVEGFKDQPRPYRK